jgi:2-polyprenyl-3-methyl-5-hydroxy-6-metoxy-1,4-benzoquinol methylase
VTNRHYEPRTYWEGVLGEQPTLSRVAYPDLPESFNRVLYRAMVAVVVGALRRTGTDLRGRSACDIGCGSGVWIELWHRLGATQVAGIDLAPAAVERLTERYPGDDLRWGDISAAEPPFPRRFDVVSAMNVLLHIKEDERFDRALRNLAAMVAADGVLLVMDPVITRGWFGPVVTEASNSKARPLAQWRAALVSNGLELVELVPVTVLLANPADTRSAFTYTLLDKYWTALQLALKGRERLGAAVGAALYRFDRPLRRLVRSGPSTKVLVARRA